MQAVCLGCRSLKAIAEEDESRSFLSEVVHEIAHTPSDSDPDLLTKLEVFSCVGRLLPDLIETSSAPFVAHVMTV